MTMPIVFGQHIFLITLFEIYRYALDNGYRHIDCAKVYLNEKEVGEIFEEYIDKKIPRKDLFIVGKVITSDLSITYFS